MRLWTFQHKSAMSILEDGVWYSDYNYSRRIKLVDEQHIQADFTLPNGKVIDTAPIYCFGSLCGKYFPALSLNSMYCNYNHLVGWMAFSLMDMVMLELEVNEDQILSAKKNNKWYVEYDKSMPKGTTGYKRSLYARVVDEHEICHSDYMSYIRKERDNDDIECLLPCINLYNVVAIRTFSRDGLAHGKYGTTKVETVYSNPTLVPLFTETIYVNGDGYPRALVDSEIKTMPSNYAFERMDENGQHGCFNYQTIEEVLSCCNEKTRTALMSELEKKGLSVKDDNVYYATVGELFPNGLTL